MLYTLFLAVQEIFLRMQELKYFYLGVAKFGQ